MDASFRIYAGPPPLGSSNESGFGADLSLGGDIPLFLLQRVNQFGSGAQGPSPAGLTPTAVTSGTPWLLIGGIILAFVLLR